MFFKKKRKGESPTNQPASRSAAGPAAAPGGVKVHPPAENERAVRRTFPGPRGARALLRVAVERAAHGELVAHARSSLDAEVCGVLVGQVCEDDEGRFVHVEAVIRGAAAAEGSTHVTFTQATWNGIHQALERDHPKMRMVGWYHTHPGFGVEFSEMDLFIQRNFFGGPTQIALVTDPVSGAVAIAANTPGGVEYLARYWVDGREQTCQAPAGRTPAAAPGGAASAPADANTAAALASLETRMTQVLQALDETRASYHRFLLFVGTVLCVGVIGIVLYTIYSQYISRNEPPRVNQIVPVPIQVGDKVVMVGVGITEWQVPPELNASLVQIEQLKLEAAEKAAKEAAKKAGLTNSGPAGTNGAPPKPK